MTQHVTFEPICTQIIDHRLIYGYEVRVFDPLSWHTACHYLHHVTMMVLSELCDYNKMYTNMGSLTVTYSQEVLPTYTCTPAAFQSSLIRGTYW